MTNDEDAVFQQDSALQFFRVLGIRVSFDISH